MTTASSAIDAACRALEQAGWVRDKAQEIDNRIVYWLGKKWGGIAATVDYKACLFYRWGEKTRHRTTATASIRRTARRLAREGTT